MSITLNRLAVPADLQEDVEKSALDRHPDSTVTWVDGYPGIIVWGIAETDCGSGHDIEANGLPLGRTEPGNFAVIAALEAHLQRFVRSRHSD